MFIDYNQSNWDELLPLAEFAINNHKSSSTGFSPFYLNYGRHPSLMDYSLPGVANPATEDFSQHIQHTLAQARDFITKAQEEQSKYYNKKRRDIHFDIGQQVLVSSENITVDNQKERDS